MIAEMVRAFNMKWGLLNIRVGVGYCKQQDRDLLMWLSA